MPVKDRSIGGTGLEQGGPNMGNDYSRNITREKQSGETTKIIVPKGKKGTQKKEGTASAKQKKNSRQ